jgi:molybdate transport repressor ModE-like protein
MAVIGTADSCAAVSLVSSRSNMATAAIGVNGDRSVLAALWDTTRMRLLVALASERSVSAAARAIGITQSTASEHVRVLELATQQPLVERHGRGSRLTEAGRALSRRAAAALAELAAGEEEIADLAGLQRGRVALAVSWCPGVYVLPYTLGCFRQKYPGVSIELEIASTAEIVDWLVAGRVGLAVVGGEPNDDRLETQPFCEDEIVGVAKPGLLPLVDGSVAAAALASQTLLAGEAGSSTQALADRELEAAGVTPATVWRLGSGEGVKRSAQEGLGFAFLSRFAVAEELEEGRLESFRIAGRQPLRRRFHVVRLAGRELTPSEARFLSTLWTCCASSPAYAAACIVPTGAPEKAWS